MKKMYLVAVVVVGWLLFCAGCMRFRMNDDKARKLFAENETNLCIGDTLISGTNVHYAISGAGHLPTLVLLHGSPGSWSNYAAYLYDADLQKKYRMIGIDRPGFGYSDFGTPLHLKEQADLLAELLLSLDNGAPVFLAGHSIGGPIVAQMAASHQNRYQKIVILSGSISPYLEKPERWRTLLDNTILRKFLPGAFAPSNTEISWFKDDLYKLEEQLSVITTDVVFVHGEKDQWVPIANVEYGIQKMTSAASIQSDTLKGEGHLIPWRRFEEVKTILMNLY